MVAWNWARSLASTGWMTRAAEALNEDAASARRSQLVLQLKCPVLVVAGGRGMVSVSEAIKLKADCLAARVDLELANHTVDDPDSRRGDRQFRDFRSLYRWLEHRLARSSAPSSTLP